MELFHIRVQSVPGSVECSSYKDLSLTPNRQAISSIIDSIILIKQNIYSDLVKRTPENFLIFQVLVFKFPNKIKRDAFQMQLWNELIYCILNISKIETKIWNWKIKFFCKVFALHFLLRIIRKMYKFASTRECMYMLLIDCYDGWLIDCWMFAIWEQSFCSFL